MHSHITKSSRKAKKGTAPYESSNTKQVFMKKNTNKLAPGKMIAVKIVVLIQYPPLNIL